MSAVGWATNMCNICVTYMYRGFGAVVAMWPGQADPLWVRSSSFQLFGTKHALNHKILTLHYAKWLENMTIEIWGWWDRGLQGRQ